MPVTGLPTSFVTAPQFDPLKQVCEVVMNPSQQPAVLSRLMQLIEERRATMPEASYTTRLLKGGVAKIGSKITEEAAEVVEAAAEDGEAGRQHLVREAADLIYHLLVMLAHRDVDLDQVEAELARREGISGLEEKASRKPRQDEST